MIYSHGQTNIFDDQGKPIQVEITVYPFGSVNPDGSLNGSPTKSTIYEDRDGDTQKSNPFTTTADGEVDFYAEAGWYDLLVSGAEITDRGICGIYLPPSHDLSLLDVRDYGALGDGETDDSDAIQSALDAAKQGQWVLIPKPADSPYTYIVGGYGKLAVPSGARILIEPGTILQCPSGAAGYASIFHIANKDDVEIVGYGAILQMAASQYGPTNSRCIYIQHSNDVRIYGVLCRYSYDDGVYVGASGPPTYADHCERILLRHVVCEGNGRNGFAVITGKQVLLDQCVATNNTGAMGGAGHGIDIEPDRNTQYAQGIVVRDCRTQDNAGVGIAVALNNLMSGGDSEGGVNVLVEGCHDQGSANGFKVFKIDCSSNLLAGQIVVRHCLSRKPGVFGFNVGNKDVAGPHVSAIDCCCIDPNEDDNPTTRAAGFEVGSEPEDAGAATIGGVSIIRPRVRDTRAVPQTDHAIYVKDNRASPDLAGVVIEDLLEMDGCPAGDEVCFFGAGEIVDRLGKLHRAFTADRSGVGNQEVASLWHNTGATQACTLTLGEVAVGSPAVSVEVRVAQTVTITPHANDRIAGWGGDGEAIRSNEIGARITLKKLATGVWTVVEMAGTWERPEQHLPDSDQELSAVNYDRVFDNDNYTGGHTVTLPAAAVGEGDLSFLVDTAQQITLQRQGTDTIDPGGATQKVASAIGCRLRLRPRVDGRWYVLEQIGTWT